MRAAFDDLVKAPCFECQDREAECHAKCVRYTEYRKKRDEIREKGTRESYAAMHTVARERGIKKKMMLKKGGRCHEK